MASRYDLHQLQLNKNCYLIASVRETKSAVQKIDNIENYLQEGADINFIDRNDQDSTPIHVAVRNNEPDIVQLLIKYGANLNLKNLKGETPLDIAQKLKTDTKQEIVNLLHAANKTENNIHPIEIPQNISQNSLITKQIISKFKEMDYTKRTGTSGVCGQLYETKILTMVLMRALNSHPDVGGEEIEHFYLGTNISGIGELDDVCLRYRVKGHPNDIVFFLQAKYRENSEKGKVTVEKIQSAKGDFSLLKYFDSYLKIKDKFQTHNDVMFDGEFNNVECNFILYTPAKDSLDEEKSKTEGNKVSKTVHYLINTGPDQTTENKVIFQYNYVEEDIDYLTKMAVIRQINQLGFEFINLVMNEAEKSQVILASKLISRYHVVLGRQVLHVSMDQQMSDSANRIWDFRSDFFTSDCEYLVTLRDTFYKVLSTTRCDQSEIKTQDKDDLNLILRKPTASNISSLIGKLLTYDEKTKKIQLLEIKEFKEMFEADEYEQLRERCNKIETTENIIREATTIKLKSRKVKLPVAFGNMDMIISKAKNNRMKTIADQLLNLFQYYKDDKNTVEINDKIVGPGKTIEKGILASNGGIGSAVGNLLVFDKRTKTMKLDLENEALPSKAASLLDELKHPRYNPINNELNSYRLKMNIGGFPKDSFHGDEYDKRQARDFLSKLWFYTNQANEDAVEEIIKNGINKHYIHEMEQNQLHTHSIFLRSHDEIQKWWKVNGKTHYISRDSEIFERAKLAVLENPLLLTALDHMCNLEIQNIGIKFNHDAILALELDNIKGLFNVVTDANISSTIKIMQHFETPSLRNKCTFIDFNYVLSLTLNDYNTMLKELGQTKIENLIIIYEKLNYSEGLCNKLKEVIRLFKGKLILVNESILANEIKEYVGDSYRSVKDDKTRLIDLVEFSQTKILEESTIVFQGEELPVKLVLDQDARSLVKTEILYKLIYWEKIEIGHPLMDQLYKNVNNFIDRKLDDAPVNTLNDIDDEVVVVSGRPGKGKSVLLTHLSLNTKQLHPLPWIVRVNLQNYKNDFKRWQEKKTTISVTFVLHFLCTIALKNIDAQMKIELGYHKGKVTVTHVNDDIDPLMLFELELFLYFYNSGQVIFLFDDFNATCEFPQYDKEVLQILKILKNEKKRMWITTFPSKHTRKPLENEFGVSYKLDPLNSKEDYLEKIISTSDPDSDSDSNPLNINMQRLRKWYFDILPEFINLIRDRDRAVTAIIWLSTKLTYHATEHILSEMSDNWVVILNTLQYFVEAHMNKFFCQENVDDRSFRSAFQSTRRDFFDKHKKLGLVASCSLVNYRSNDLEKLLAPEEISEVQYTLFRISRSKDRKSIVNYVVNLVFAEYFAVECLTDMMKSLAKDDETGMNRLNNAILWQSIMKLLLFDTPPGVRQRFDYKLQSDGSLAELANSPMCQEVVFELLLKNARAVEARGEGGAARGTPVSDAVEEDLHNIANLLLSSIQHNLNQGNVDEILRLLGSTRDKFAEFGKEYKDILHFEYHSLSTFTFVLNVHNIPTRKPHVYKIQHVLEDVLDLVADTQEASDLQEFLTNIIELLKIIHQEYDLTDNIGLTCLIEFAEYFQNDVLLS